MQKGQSFKALPLLHFSARKFLACLQPCVRAPSATEAKSPMQWGSQAAGCGKDRLYYDGLSAALSPSGLLVHCFRCRY